MRKDEAFSGHKINANGLHPLTEKVEAIAEAPKPQNKYMYVRQFTIVTDHKPLFSLLNENESHTSDDISQDTEMDSHISSI